MSKYAQLLPSIVLAAMLTAIGGCQSQRHAAPGAAADRSTKYVSQLGNFTCPVPTGARSSESSTLDSDLVSFSDAGGLRLRVDSFTLAHVFTAVPRGNDQWQAALQTIFYRYVMARQFLRRSLKATVLSEDYVDSPVGKAYFAVVNVPSIDANAAPAVKLSDAQQDDLRPGAVYGVLLFAARNYLYIVGVMAAPNDPASSPEQQASLLLEKLQRTTATMAFK